MNAIQNWFRMLRTIMMVFMKSLKDVDPTPEGQSGRVQFIEELIALQQQDREEEAAHQRRLKTLSSELLAVEREADELRQNVSLEHRRRIGSSFKLDARITKLRQEIADSCPVDIEAFLDQVNVEIDHCQRNHNPEPKMTQRLIELRRIREEATALRTAPIPAIDLLARFGHLQSNSGLIH